MACVITTEGKEIKTFGNKTDDILALIDWLKEKGCTHVAQGKRRHILEPIYKMLEPELVHPLVVNGQHIKESARISAFK
ncbi:transposase [Moorella thermoacetica]|uniref:Transposase n=1 Tax=Moorella thermoacetica (strain ATCC 39073 / JCM 9320) TaxID=264732 RepID=Q2RLD0_MOOTA|nr:transposase [Moorella thermoacetica]AKX93177.1 hypothetical protein MOTHE_c03640 [Moorella thermoacetica]AKX95819.1 hypothetical protein MOTHA_c04530 [Moorella thermoacetica]OIQ11618.1 hypothetical protein MOOTH_14050 [Moorella thermoacetica]OIQ55906.1 hypothetical protein MOCA_16000 [Moorella thermoacetica]QCZ99633.1 hypothetical protein MothHH_00466 [Moorella thermoacetica]